MIYIASKTSHAERWRALRYDGVPIISTWIDEAGLGQSKSLQDLWERCVSEVLRASCIIAYREADEVLKGGLVEIGVALGAGKPVFLVGFHESNFSFKNHPLCRVCATLEAALKLGVKQRYLCPSKLNMF